MKVPDTEQTKLVDEHVAELYRTPGEHVRSVHVGRTESSGETAEPRVYLRPGWEKHGLREFSDLVDQLRGKDAR